MIVNSERYSSFLIGNEVLSTEDKKLYYAIKNDNGKFKSIYQNTFGDALPQFEDLIKLYVFCSEIATQEQKQSTIESASKNLDLSPRAVELFIFPIKFIEYYQQYIEENIFSFIPSAENAKNTREKQEKAMTKFYIVAGKNGVDHVIEYDSTSENLQGTYNDVSQYLTYNITQFEISNADDYHSLQQSIHSCQDSTSLKKILKDKYGPSVTFGETEFSTYSMDNNQYHMIRFIQMSPNGRMAIENMGNNRYIVLFLNRTYYSNPKFKPKKHKLAKITLVRKIINSIDLRHI